MAKTKSPAAFYIFFDLQGEKSEGWKVDKKAQSKSDQLFALY
jgi:hypothetical protein